MLTYPSIWRGSSSSCSFKQKRFVQNPNISTDCADFGRPHFWEAPRRGLHLREWEGSSNQWRIDDGRFDKTQLSPHSSASTPNFDLNTLTPISIPERMGCARAGDIYAEATSDTDTTRAQYSTLPARCRCQGNCAIDTRKGWGSGCTIKDLCQWRRSEQWGRYANWWARATKHSFC